MMHFAKMSPLLSWRNAVSRERFSAPSSPETAVIHPAQKPRSEPQEKRGGGIGQSVRVIHALQLYGASGVASFGWALSKMLGFSCARYAPLWFAGALLVYNLDRLKLDPADVLNTPERLGQHKRFRVASAALATLSALLLIALPAQAGDWLLLLLTPAAAVVSLSYSFPVLGFRFKDVPAVKTFFAPTIVLIAYLAPALLHRELRPDARVLSGAAWSECLLLFNMVLCDLRDIIGDRTLGTRSIPVLLGERKTMWLLAALLTLQFFTALANGWTLLGGVSALYLGALWLAVRKPQSESFYEWFVEGILFLPAFVVFAEMWK